MSLGQGQGQEPQGEGLCSWNKEDIGAEAYTFPYAFPIHFTQAPCVPIEAHLLRIFFGIIRNELYGR